MDTKLEHFTSCRINNRDGNDPNRRRTNIPTFAKVQYHDVYPGTDLVYYGNQDIGFEIAPVCRAPNTMWTRNANVFSNLKTFQGGPFFTQFFP